MVEQFAHRPRSNLPQYSIGILTLTVLDIYGGEFVNTKYLTKEQKNVYKLLEFRFMIPLKLKNKTNRRSGLILEDI